MSRSELQPTKLSVLGSCAEEAATDGHRAIDDCLRLGLLADRATRCLRKQLEEHTRRSGINETSFRLLWRVAQSNETEGIRQVALARELGISTAQTSTLVESCRKQGWLQGHRPLNDRRRQVWKLTSQGRDLLDSLLPDLQQWSKRLFDGDFGQSMHQLEPLLQQLILATEMPAGDKPRILPAPLTTRSTEAAATGKRGAA